MNTVDIEEMGGDRTVDFKATNVNLDAAVTEFHNSIHGTKLEKIIVGEYGIEWVESIDYEETVLDLAQTKAEEYGYEVEILAAKVYGSRE